MQNPVPRDDPEFNRRLAELKSGALKSLSGSYADFAEYMGIAKPGLILSLIHKLEDIEHAARRTQAQAQTQQRPRACNLTATSCPECGGPLAYSEGCKICHSCGWSACG